MKLGKHTRQPLAESESRHCIFLIHALQEAMKGPGFPLDWVAIDTNGERGGKEKAKGSRRGMQSTGDFDATNQPPDTSVGRDRWDAVAG